MFRGEYHNIIDEKGRLSIPAKFREQFTTEHEGVPVLTRGLDNCLYLYPGDTWKKNEEQLSRLNPFDAKSRKLITGFMGSSEECEFDKQGRIAVSPVLRKAANLSRNVAVVGLLNRIEIWDREAYEKYRGEAVASLETLAQMLSDKGGTPELTL
jgi:MraZ protein